MVEARKVKITGDDAWAQLAGAGRIIVGRGRKQVHYDPAVDDREEILAACTGRTGNLRAPTVRVGDLLLVGFHEEMYADVFA